MINLNIRICLDNDAFDGTTDPATGEPFFVPTENAHEPARIIERVLRDIRNYGIGENDEKTLRDSNGNSCGRYWIEVDA